MLSKAKQLYISFQPCLNFCGQDFHNNSNGTIVLLRRAFCTVIEPLKSEDSSNTNESPELPAWVKSSGKDGGVHKPEDDDFVPPSVSYWIENHNSPEIGVKTIVNDVVETDVDKISKILKNRFKSPYQVVKALDGCDVDVSDSLVEQVLKRFSCEWIPAFGLFKWSESRKGIVHSPDLYNLMVDNLGKTKKFDVMWELVEIMKNLEDYLTLETMTKVMRRLSRAGKYDDAVEMFRNIEKYGVERDINALNMLMDALVKQGSVEHAEGVFFAFKDYIPPTSQTYNVLVHGWCKARKIDKAKKTLDEMKEHGFPPDSITYTCFIEAYCREKNFRKVDETLDGMRRKGFRPSVVTYTIIMTALSKAKETHKAMKLYEQMKEENISPDASFCNVFINALSKAGLLKDSDAVFEDMSNQGVAPDVFTFNTLITIATQNLQEEKALKLLLKMEESGCKPDLNTYTPLLKMCCRLKRMKVISFLLNHMFKNDVGMDLGTYCLLVSGLCKSGKLEHACSFFEESMLKGFIPMDCTYKNLVEALEKKGMGEEKKHIEELMVHAKRQISAIPT